MKFTTIALLSVVTAIQVTKISNKDLNQVFNRFNTNKDNTLDEAEMVAGVESIAKQFQHGPITKEEEAKAYEIAHNADKDSDNKLNEKEFNHAARAFIKEFGPKPKVSDKELNKVFNRFNTVKKIETLDEGEIRAGVIAIAKEFQHGPITDVEEAKIYKMAHNADKNGDKVLNRTEFKKAARAFIEEFAPSSDSEGEEPQDHQEPQK